MNQKIYHSSTNATTHHTTKNKVKNNIIFSFKKYKMKLLTCHISCKSAIPHKYSIIAKTNTFMAGWISLAGRSIVADHISYKCTNQMTNIQRTCVTCEVTGGWVPDSGGSYTPWHTTCSLVTLALAPSAP